VLRAHKEYRDGTDRLMPPNQTLAWVRPHLAAMGITRVANVTGLDTVGIPVFMACRPNARALAVSQGKGATPDAARVSAIMEAVESHHAERIHLPLVLGSHAELRARHPLVDAFRLGTGARGPFLPHRPLLWVQGHDLVKDEARWVPFDVVHLDFTYDAPTGRRMFDITSNGLASGNHILEATSHAICELVERDATALWSLLQPDRRRRTRVDLATVDDAVCRDLLGRLRRAGMAVAVWETTSDIGLPSFACSIVEDPGQTLRPLGVSKGYGCHPRREVALSRALSEAAQCRLTLVAGSRDDLFRSEYERQRDRRRSVESWATIVDSHGVRDFRQCPTFVHQSFADDVRLAVERLQAAGVREVVVVDLTRPEFDIPVVRAVVPGLEFAPNPTTYRPRGRALSAVAAHP